MIARILLTAPLMAVVLAIQPTQAATVVSTINGYYDVDAYDTPSLHIDNSSSYAFTNIQLKVTGYQGLNNGVSESVSLANIAAGTTGIVTWGSIPGTSASVTPGNMFAYDYDDEYGGTFSAQVGYGLSFAHSRPGASVRCARMGRLRPGRELLCHIHGQLER